MSREVTRLLTTALFAATAYGANPAAPPFDWNNAQTFLKTYCQTCHGGKSGVGGFSVQRISAQDSLRADPRHWTSVARRVKNGEMPPKGSLAPTIDLREQFTSWIDERIRAEACTTGPVPGPSPVRRLNRDEYSATVRDLLSINIDVGHALPADGAGGEGFDNAAETLFLSPIHAEKYMDAAKQALDFVATDAQGANQSPLGETGAGVSPEQAMRAILDSVLPRAFRRPIVPGEAERYLPLFRTALKSGETFDRSALFALRGVLISPEFLFRLEPVNSGPAPRQVDDYTLASRLSYFLWGTMPDDLLWDIAASGRLQEPDILRGQVGRMIRSPRSLAFVQRFTEQWLRTRDLGPDKSPDSNLYPAWAGDEELRSDIKYQPVLFVRELLISNLSLLNLLDSRFTLSTRKLSKLYGIQEGKRERAEMLHRVDLPEGSDRGGLLGMSAVLAVSSYPNRTSPVLRGAWVLDTILGTPPPPPPANVPKLEEGQAAHPKSVRERLEQHRANPTCAGCHSRIDPIGFALENYDVLGQWRTEDAGKSIDSSGELADGTRLNGPAELKRVLLERKDLFLRNLTRKMLGYALGRGLTLSDTCTVEEILAGLQTKDYSAQSLIEAVVFSVPFRQQPGAPQQTRQPGTGTPVKSALLR